MAELRASAPGKVILMGEHAAVYGKPAVVAAVGLRITADLRELGAKDPARLELADLSATEEISWEEILRYTAEAREAWRSFAASPSRESFQRLQGRSPSHLVKIALGEALAAGGQTPSPPRRGIHLKVTSKIPLGSGFGSSAALAASILVVAAAWQGKALSLAALEEAALEVDRRQHGLPSGIDTATVLEGGILSARREGEDLVTSQVQARREILRSFSLFDSGPPTEPTGSVVAEVRALKEQAPHRVEALLETMELETRRFQRALLGIEPEEDVLRSMKAFERCLEELGVVPQEVQRRVRQVEAAGGAAKISGAGSLSGPGAGSLLVYHPDPESFGRWTFLSDFRRFFVPFGDSGARLEPSDPVS